MASVRSTSKLFSQIRRMGYALAVLGLMGLVPWILGGTMAGPTGLSGAAAQEPPRASGADGEIEEPHRKTSPTTRPGFAAGQSAGLSGRTRARR